MTNETRPHVLIAEDDADVADLLVIHLSELPCNTDVVATGAEALSRATSGKYDVLVLDVGLPLLDGLAVCQQLRQRRVFTPILMLTARVSEADRIVGLDIGADDYLTKPFSPREFQARVKALLRRAMQYSSPPADGTTMTCGELTIAAERRQVTVGGKVIDLTAREFDLLLWMARHPGRVFTRDQLLDAVWGYSHAGYGHTVDSHINRLRAKLEPNAREPQYVLTVRNVGYKLGDA